MLSHPGRWHATVLLLLLGALGLLTVSSPSTAAALRSARESKSHPTEVSARNTVYLANGTGDGTASVYVDPFGQFSTLYYNPVGPTGSADTTYYSSVWFSGAGRAGVGNQGRWLSSSYIPKVTFTVQEPSRAVSQWTSDNLSFQLEQELQPTNGRGSTLRQVYRITNPGTVGTNFDLIRHVDGDLSFDGSIRDLAGVSQSRQLLYEFDSGDNPSALTTFVGIDLNRSANLGFQIAPYSYTGTISQLGRGALKNQVAGDLDADGVTDSPYDVTMSLGQTFTVPPGVTISFVTNTVLGEGTAGLVPEAFRVIPRSGGVGGTVSATISGASFVPGAATVRLKGEGQSPITGTETRVLSANTLRTTFDLTGAAVGPRDVEVVFSDGNVLTLSQAFTVEPHARPELWVDVTGRGAIRVGREQTFTVLYGNRGNADAMAVPLWLTGIPEGSTYRLDSELRHPPQRAGAPTVNWDQFPIGVLEGNSVSVPLLLGFVPAGETGSLRITITLPAAQTFRLGARISQPFIDAATAPALMRALRTKQSPAARRQALQALAVQAAATSSASGCGLAIVNELLNLAGIFPGFSCAN
ncbi:MAG: hypothetical protein K0Q72_2525, partial [Armatimonadetes bacterium]|nr:hypothetical protein [Armatimonadota bacterium]